MPHLPPDRFDVLGVRIHASDYAQASAMIVRAAVERRPFAATALAVHGLMTGYRDPLQRARLNALDLVAPDGQPVRWALNSLHRARLLDRVYGPFLMLRVCASAAAEGLPVFLFGSTAHTLAALSTALRERIPALRIAGTQPSRFRLATDDEWNRDVQTLRDSGARIVFCGLGCPRQEAWVHAMRRRLDSPLVAVGAAFPLWAGEQPMAPAWMQGAGLEWLFRLAREPRRLAYRYFVYNPWFVGALARETLRSARRPPRPEPPSPEAPELRWS